MKETSPPAPEAPKPRLPEKTSSARQLTYSVPHILKSIAIDEAGFIHHEIRQGGNRQIDFETTIEYSETAVDESAEVFAVRATNQINVASSIINVINDEVELPNFRLVPTRPTASEYLKRVGERVMVSSICRSHRHLSEVMGTPVYQIARAFITLP